MYAIRSYYAKRSAGPDAARSTGALFRGPAADADRLEPIDAARRIAAQRSLEAAVDHEIDALDRQRGLGDIGREDDPTRTSRREDAALLVERLNSVKDRITSYNVCYTKLLRGHAVALPVILDIIHIDPDSGRLDWSVEATVDLVAGEPHLPQDNLLLLAPRPDESTELICHDHRLRITCKRTTKRFQCRVSRLVRW